jgi:hypothetical protein
MARVVTCWYKNLDSLFQSSSSVRAAVVDTVPPKVTRYLGERLKAGMFTGLALDIAFCFALFLVCGMMMMDGMRF